VDEYLLQTQLRRDADLVDDENAELCQMLFKNGAEGVTRELNILDKTGVSATRTRGGLSWLGRRRLRKAESQLNQAVEIWPGFWNAWWFLGKSAQARGENTLALERFERSMKLAPWEIAPSREAGAEAFSLRLGKKAERYSRAALELAPDDSENYSNLAAAFLLNRNTERARSLIEVALELTPDDPTSQHILSLIERGEKGDWPLDPPVDGEAL
jgi:Tfp pilus assembly protein PilF